MFWEVFLKKILEILGNVLIFRVFRVESFFEVFFLEIESMGFMADFGRFFCSGHLSLGFPLEFRYISVLPPMYLPLFFDHSSIVLRFPNGDRTENERRMNGERTENERRTNGKRTENERRTNGERTELERSSNGGWTEDERSLNGGWTELERRMNGGSTEDQRRMNGERSKTEWRANGGVDSLSQAFCVPSCMISECLRNCRPPKWSVF